jgi:hypothetical protein
VDTSKLAAGTLLLTTIVISTAILVGKHVIPPESFTTLATMVVAGALGAYNPSKKEQS